MLNKFTYRQKLKYLGIGAILLLFISYQFSIAKTIREYKIYKQYKSSYASSLNEEISMNLLQSKNNMLNEILNKFTFDTIDQSKNLLGVAGDFCNTNNLQLKEYKPFPAIHDNFIRTLTRSITVQGDFINCLRLLYYLETQSNVGRIGSVSFKSYTIPGKPETVLNCTIFVQNLIPSKNENE